MKLKWQLPCEGYLCHMETCSWGTSAPMDVPNHSPAATWGSWEANPVSVLWVLGSLGTLQSLVCAAAISCLIKMALILTTKAFQPRTPELAADA